MSDSFSPYRKPPAQANQSLIAGFEVLMVVISAGRPIGCREVADELGVNSTKANRLLGTLASMGLIVQSQGRKYEPGPGLHVFAAMSLRGSRLLKVALPELRQLSIDTGLTAALGTLWHGRVCYLYHGKASGPLEDAMGSHSLYPAAQSSIGRLLLAGMPAESAREAIADQDPGIDFGDVDTLISALPGIRQQGYALRDQDDRSLAVPIGDQPAYAGVALAGTISDAQIPKLVDLLKPAAARIATLIAQRP